MKYYFIVYKSGKVEQVRPGEYGYRIRLREEYNPEISFGLIVKLKAI